MRLLAPHPISSLVFGPTKCKKKKSFFFLFFSRYKVEDLAAVGKFAVAEDSTRARDNQSEHSSSLFAVNCCRGCEMRRSGTRG